MKKQIPYETHLLNVLAQIANKVGNGKKNETNIS
jgi:hypothetical protein